MLRHVVIYQASFGEGTEPVGWLFMDYDFAIAHGWSPEAYENVYESDLELMEDTYVALDQCFVIFNMNRPDDYYGRSLSVSDVVMLDDAAYYVDSFGFVEVDMLTY